MTEFLGDGTFPEFDYESESDTLTIWGGGQAGSGFDITRGIFILFLDYDHATPVGLTLSPAAKLLAPYLPIKSIANIKPALYRDDLDLKVKYDCEKDTLWMGNSRTAEIRSTLIDGAVEIWFQAGSDSVLDSDGKIPSGVMVYDAVKHIEPAIVAELAELAAAGGTD